MSPRRSAFFAILVTILLLPSFVRAQTKLRVAYPTTVGSMGILWVTKDAELFDKYGLDVTLIYISGSSKMFSARTSSSNDLLSTNVS